jgi:Arc/MetJ family transcription regulator
MITSIEIDDKLWARAWSHRTPKMTKRAFIEEALRVYVKLHDQAKAKKLRGKLVWSGGVKDLREE